MDSNDSSTLVGEKSHKCCSDARVDVTQEDVLKKFNESIEKNLLKKNFVQTFPPTKPNEESLAHNKNAFHGIYIPPRLSKLFNGDKYFYVSNASKYECNNIDEIAVQASKAASQFLYSSSKRNISTIEAPSIYLNSGSSLYANPGPSFGEEKFAPDGEFYGQELFPAETKVRVLTDASIVFGTFFGLVRVNQKRHIVLRQPLINGQRFGFSEDILTIEETFIKDINIIEAGP